MSLKDQVYNILEQYPIARNSDHTLYCLLIGHYYPDSVKQIDGVFYYKGDTLREVSRADCQRYRAYFQNDRGIFPAVEEVKNNREIKREQMGIAFSPSNPVKG